jgi:DNA modification methylase
MLKVSGKKAYISKRLGYKQRQRRVMVVFIKMARSIKEFYEFIQNPKRNKRSVWTITTKPFKGAHFATFPKDLIEPCVLAGCPEGGTVLDPFGGSGTTGIVAAQHKRNAVLLELNQEYIDLAKDRINQEVRNEMF